MKNLSTVDLDRNGSVFKASNRDLSEICFNNFQKTRNRNVRACGFDCDQPPEESRLF